MSKDKLRPTERIETNLNPTQTLNLTSTNSNPEPCCESEDCGMDEASPVSKTQKITINALDFGYNVKVGCQTIAVEEIPKLIKNLEAYLNNPKEIERKWMKDKKLL